MAHDLGNTDRLHPAAALHDEIIFRIAYPTLPVQSARGGGGWRFGARIQPLMKNSGAFFLHLRRVQRGGAPESGLVGRQSAQATGLAVPAKFDCGMFLEKEEGKRFDAFERVVLEKKFRIGEVEEIEQQQSAAAAVRRFVSVFCFGAVQDTGCFAAAGGGDPGSAGAGVAGKDQGVPIGFDAVDAGAGAVGGFVAVVGEEEAGGGWDVGDSTHGLKRLRVYHKPVKDPLSKKIFC